MLKAIFGEHGKQMSDRERLSLTFFQKWVRYGRFPFRFLIHVTLVVALWIQVSTQLYIPYQMFIQDLDFHYYVQLCGILSW